MAQRLNAAVRGSDTVTRLGGDEFAFILPEIHQEADAGIVAQKILEAFGSPFVINEHSIEITCSIGISLFPINGEDVQTLLKKADTAMYNAKNKGKNQFLFSLRIPFPLDAKTR